MRRTLVFLAILTLVMGTAAVPARAETITTSVGMNVDIVPIDLDTIPLVPVRAVAQKVGGTVVWHGETRTATISTSDVTVELTVDQAEAHVNGHTVKMAGPAVMRDGTLMAPAEFLSVAFRFPLNFAYPGGVNLAALALARKSQFPADMWLSVAEEVNVKETAPDARTFYLGISDNGPMLGGDALIDTRVDQGAGSGIRFTTAVRNGRAYVQRQGRPWTEVDTDQAMARIRQTMQSMVDLARIEHVASARWGNRTIRSEHTEQAVVLTPGPAADTEIIKAIQPMINQVLGVVLPADPNMQSEITLKDHWVRLTSDVETDVITQCWAVTTLDVDATSLGQTYHLQLNLNQTVSSSQAFPPAWPRDLPAVPAK